MTERRALILAVGGSALAGALLTLSFAPVALWPAGFVSAALLFWCLDRVRSGRGALLTGLAFGIGKYGTGASWVYVSIDVYGNAGVALASLLTAIFVGGLALFPALMAWLWWTLLRGQRTGLNLLAFASLWTLTDWLMTWFLSGFPWLFPGYAHTDTWLGALAPVLGVLGLGWLVVAMGAALLVCLRRPLDPVRLVPVVLLWLIPWGIGLALQGTVWTKPVGPPRTVLLVQGNVPQEQKWQRGMASQILATYQGLSTNQRGVDLVLWPEVALTVGWPAARPWLEDQVSAIAAGNETGEAALVTGILTLSDDGGYRNGAVAVGSASGVYEKRRLVPFGDYLPFEGALRGLIEFFDMPFSGTAPGAWDQPPLQFGDLRVAMAICYEIAFPRLVAAEPGNLIATITNDTWFGASAGPHQHFQMARMRAMETQRPVIRAANNGITAAIDPLGTVLARLPQFEQGALRADVQPAEGATPYMAFGHYALLGFCFLIVGVGVWLREGSAD